MIINVKFVKYLTVLIMTVGLLEYGETMTKSQLNSAIKLMKNVCLPKSKVTNDQVANIKKGDIPNDENVKCYISCVYTMAQTTKNGKFNYEASKKQIDIMLPEEMKAGARVSLDQCRSIGENTSEECESAYQMAKCLYSSNPKNFVFP